MNPDATFTTIRTTATVQEGGLIVIHQPNLAAGSQVEVLIMLDPDLRPGPPRMSDEEFRRGFGKALAEAGYDTREKIVELVRDVKREIADERFGPRK